MYGSGTERVEDVLKSAFSNVPIIRVDHDTTKLRGSIEAIYEKVHSSNEAILVGTQMLKVLKVMISQGNPMYNFECR